ncbi:uncharacterized protein VTP21DRAFT_11258 [Calcarisporiella thermophila]|uniref:uncharacterized protein n=1 Tax=Calcarisporiella thermophila TaxID=911321 RepID=UPI0037441ACB
MSGQRQTGRVKFFNSTKGYGFIIPDSLSETNEEVFVHHTAIHNAGGFKSLAENEPVEFELVRGPKGYQATYVTGPNGQPVKGDPSAGHHRASAGYAGYLPMGYVYTTSYASPGQPNYGYTLAPPSYIPYPPQSQQQPQQFVQYGYMGNGGAGSPSSGSGVSAAGVPINGVSTVASEGAAITQAFVPYVVSGFQPQYPYGQSGPS